MHAGDRRRRTEPRSAPDRRNGGRTSATTHHGVSLADGPVQCSTHHTLPAPGAPASVETLYPDVAEFVAACGPSRHGPAGDVTVLLDGTEVTESHIRHLSPHGSRPS
jgi:hypothetical protein